MALDVANLYDTEFNSVYQYVSFRVRHRELTEELVSQIFMKVVEKADTYKPQRGATQRSWLFAIVRNTLADHFKKRRHETVPVDEVEVVDTDTPSAGDQLDTKQDLEQMYAAIEELPERQREIILLRYKSGLKNKEIAQVLDIDQRSVSAALSKATNTLRTELALSL